MLRETKILRWADLKPILGLSRMTVYRMEKAGEFPKRIRLASGNSVGWLEHEVEAWLAERMASRVEDESAPARPDDVYDESMDGDHESALASAGWGVDESYGGSHERF